MQLKYQAAPIFVRVADNMSACLLEVLSSENCCCTVDGWKYSLMPAGNYQKLVLLKENKKTKPRKLFPGTLMVNKII